MFIQRHVHESAATIYAFNVIPRKKERVNVHSTSLITSTINASTVQYSVAFSYRSRQQFLEMS